jgi:phospholipase C
MGTAIKHVFVLMMENRSFDHLLGFSGVNGVRPPDPSWGVTPSASDRAPIDPLHEFEDVQLQMAGNPPMSGFSQRWYRGVSLSACSSASVPVFIGVAREYLLFDNWFSSMPGPTWPNRGLNSTPGLFRGASWRAPRRYGRSSWPTSATTGPFTCY